MSQPHRILVPFLAAVLQAAVVCPAAAQTKAGDVFPSLAGAGLSGVVPDSAGKVVLVDFWASWCAPCRASFPAYARLQSQYAPRGLVIVAVSVDEDQSDYDGFLRKFAPPFSTVRDQGQHLAAAVGIPGMPTSYLMDRSGRVRWVHEGFHSGDTEPALRREIELLLSEK
jgi:thiol-disulfide isomerase/thioredoxin